LKVLDWVAILGALAWLPHVISFLKNHFTKSEVRIITQKFAEIGFTTLGPIFNMRIAFSVKNHDLVISNFKIRVIHESGEEKLFEWQGMRQHVMKMNTNDGPIPYEKESSVLAIKLNQKEVEEKIIQCQEVTFISGKKEVEDVAVKKLTFEREQEGYDPLKFLQIQESVDLYNYIKQAFSWKAGKYTVVYDVESPERFELVGNKYEFSLTPIDIEELERNKGEIEQDYINGFVEDSHDSYKEIFWKWRNPSIKEKI